MKVPMKEVLNLSSENILSHVILECLAQGPEGRALSDKIILEREGLSKEERDNYLVDLRLMINGEEVDPSNFFNLYKQQWSRLVKDAAMKLLQERLGNRFVEVMDKIRDIEQVVDEWAKSVNWEVPNPFLKG